MQTVLRVSVRCSGSSAHFPHWTVQSVRAGLPARLSACGRDSCAAGEPGFNLLIRLLFGLTYNDTQCGAKVFTKTAIDAVLPQMVSTGFEFDVELLWRLQHAGFRIGKFPSSGRTRAIRGCRSGT